MRLKKIHIKEFAQIKDFFLEPGKVTVIHGNNESGKTMILDALLDALFEIRQRREKEQFQGLERYDQKMKFSGTVEVEDNSAILVFPSEVRLDRAAGVANFRHIRNLLIVRESDLEPHEATAAKWWSELKDKLSGFEHGLTGIAENIREEVGLTPEGKWINRAGRRIQEEIEKLNQMSEKLKRLTAEVEELSRIKSRRKRLEHEEKEKGKRITALKEARERERYQSAVLALRRLKQGEERLKSLSGLEPSVPQEWRRLLTETGTARESVRNRENEKKILISRINEKEEEVKSLRDTVSTWEAREVELVPALQKKIAELQELHERQKKVSRYLPLAPAASAVLAVLALLFLILAAVRSPAFLAGAAPSAALLVYLVILRSRWRSISVSIEEEKNRLISTFKNLIGPPGASDAQSWIEEERRISERAKGAITATGAEIEKDKSHLKQLDSSIDELQKKISSLREQEEKLRQNTGCATANELDDRLKERNEELLPTIERQKEVLSHLLGASDADQWEAKIEHLKRYESAEGKNDEKELENLERKLIVLREEREALLQQEREIDKRLIEVGCDSPEDAWDKIAQVEEKLLTFDRDQKAANLATSVIEELASQQESLINSVLEGDANSASHHFSLATDSRYKTVLWQGSEIYVQTPSGRKFSFDQLSSGARAQLLFSIRLALLERLFGETSLFLLLDDPFITSDSARLERMIEMLFRLSERGWQVIYFTVDRDVPQMFSGTASRLGIASGADGLVLKHLPSAQPKEEN